MLIRTAVAAALLISLFVSSAHSACWRIENLRGHSAKAFDSYDITPDTLRGKIFRLAIEQGSASLSPNGGLSCTRVSSYTAICAATDGAKAMAEVWSVDPVLRKAYQVHSRSGSGKFDGATLFVGDIVGTCD